jgi:hypothetical protein
MREIASVYRKNQFSSIRTLQSALSLSLLKIEPHLSKCGGSLRVYSGRQIGFL